MPAVNKPRGAYGQTGVGLIEVLIAVLVLSIGFLGVAALQAKALANNGNAMIRTQASIAAYSMFDALRSDRAAALLGDYNVPTITVGACPAAGATLQATQTRIWCLGFDPANPPAPLPGSGAYTAAAPPPPTLLGGLAALGAGTVASIDCQNTGATATASNCRIIINMVDSKAANANQSQTMTFWTQI